MVFKPSNGKLYNAQPMRLGVVGKPSDWLIASTVDYREVKERMKMQIIIGKKKNNLKRKD